MRKHEILQNLNVMVIVHSNHSQSKIYIKLSEKFLSFYKKIIDARLLNYARM